MFPRNSKHSIHRINLRIPKSVYCNRARDNQQGSLVQLKVQGTISSRNIKISSSSITISSSSRPWIPCCEIRVTPINNLTNRSNNLSKKSNWNKAWLLSCWITKVNRAENRLSSWMAGHRVRWPLGMVELRNFEGWPGVNMSDGAKWRLVRQFRRLRDDGLIGRL